MLQFTPLVAFTSPDTQSVYLPGLIYTVRPENQRLATLVEGWLAEGKVTLISKTQTTARIGGNGRVQ